MKKLTAGIFATILGLTAVDAFAAQVASTNYVQGAIQSLDSSVAATAGTALTGVTVVDGKITGKTEVAIPTAEGVLSTYDASAAVTAPGNVVTGVTIADGVMTVSEAKVQYANVEGTPNLATVATSGSYDDLTNKPAIPTAEGILSTYDASAAVTAPGNVVTGVTIADGVMTVSEAKVQYANVEGTPNLATVATSGSYDDLTNKPTLFTNSDVNGGTADAGTNYLLQSVSLTNGVLTPGTTVEIVDTYVAPTPTAE